LSQPVRLDAWFGSVDTPQYTRDLLFSSDFNLISQVVCGIQESVNAAYQAGKEQVGTCIVSVYTQLNLERAVDRFANILKLCVITKFVLT
jgi:hypothetical protein